MSKDDYAKLHIQAPARLLVALALAFGSGAGYHFVLNIGGGLGTYQQELDACVYALAESGAVANEYERDIAALNRWATETVESLGSVQRLEALRSAPRAYSFVRGGELSP